MEFMVMMDIRFPADMPPERRRELLQQESEAARPYLDSGKFARVWRTWGSHEGDHGHMALWDAQSLRVVELAYASFPLVRLRYGTVRRIFPLQVNPNDRRNAPLVAEEAPFPLTYYNLSRWLDQQGQPSGIANEGTTAELAPGVTVHDHPHSGRPRELHFMVDGQKIAEIGPVTQSAGGFAEDVAPAYIDLLAEWDGKPVRHDTWKNRILADNGLLFPDHQSAKNAPRVRREIP